MTALLFLFKQDFLEVDWPGRQIRAIILCETEYPFVVTYSSTSMQLKATFSCLAVGYDDQLVVHVYQADPFFTCVL